MPKVYDWNRIYKTIENEIPTGKILWLLSEGSLKLGRLLGIEYKSNGDVNHYIFSSLEEKGDPDFHFIFNVSHWAECHDIPEIPCDIKDNWHKLKMEERKESE